MKLCFLDAVTLASSMMFTSEVKSSSTVKFAFLAMFDSALKFTDLPPGIRGLAVWP